MIELWYLCHSWYCCYVVSLEQMFFCGFWRPNPVKKTINAPFNCIVKASPESATFCQVFLTFSLWILAIMRLHSVNFSLILESHAESTFELVVMYQYGCRPTEDCYWRFYLMPPKELLGGPEVSGTGTLAADPSDWRPLFHPWSHCKNIHLKSYKQNRNVNFVSYCGSSTSTFSTFPTIALTNWGVFLL